MDKMENKKESDKVQEVVEEVEVEVNEEEEEWMKMDPEQVRQGREEEMNHMVKTLKMFEFGSWEDATSRTSKIPTTTKWVDRARGFKPKRDGPRDDLFAAMPPLG